MASNSTCSMRYTPLLGVGPDDPVCGLLEFDGCQLLLDCGSTDKFHSEHLQVIQSVLPQVQAVVISHGDMRHAGALPVLLAQGLLPLSLPLICTLPVRTMSNLMFQELLADKQACSDFSLFTAQHLLDLNDARRWKVARFYQRLEVIGLGAAGLLLTPYPAGHTLGGAVWRIVGQHGHEAVYAVDWCHRKERHLGSCLLPDWFNRPSALIMDARAALQPQLDSIRRDAEFLDLLVSTLRGCDGSVLVVVPTTTRLLELALLLDEFWAREKFERIYPAVMISAVATAVVEAAQSQLEWMSDTVTKTFEMKRENPFNLRCIRTMTNVSQLTQLPTSGPKVVLAGAASLDHGPARQLFVDWAAEERNTMCFVQRPEPGSLAWTVLHHVAGAGAPPLTLPVAHTRRVALEGAELEAWLSGREQPQDAMEMQPPSPVVPERTEQAGRSVSHAAATGLAATQSAILQGGLAAPLRSSSIHLSSLVRDASGHLVQQLSRMPPGSQSGGSTSSAAAVTHVTAPATAVATAGKAVVLMDGFEPPQGAAYPMFPDEDGGVLSERWDEYGVVVDQQAFKDATAAMNTFQIQPAGASYGRVKRQPAVKMEVDEDDEDDDGDAGMLRGKIKNGLTRGKVKSEADAESESGDEDEDRPTKLVEEKVEVVVRAAVRYFNYEGLADANIVRQAVSDIAPQALVLLQGTSASRSDLAAHAKRELQGFGAHIHMPRVGETIDLTVPALHAVHISDALHGVFPNHALGKSKYEGMVVEAEVDAPDPHFPELPQLVPMEGPNGLAGTPHASLLHTPSLTGSDLDAAHHHLLLNPRASGSLDEAGHMSASQQGWLGDVFFASGAEGVRLSELQAALAKENIRSVWLGPGALSCGPVVISKAELYKSVGEADQGSEEALQAGKGHLVVEGAISEQHDDLLHSVRNVIYTLFGVKAEQPRAAELPT